MKPKTKLMTLTVALAAVFALAAAQPCAAQTSWSVTSTADDGAGTLRAALASAEHGDTIDFDLELPATITLTSGQLVVDKSVIILGPGPADLVVNGNAASRVFSVQGGVTAAIADLTITNGNAGGLDGGGIFNVKSTLLVSNCVLSGNSADRGGGIYNDGTYTGGSATLTVANCTVSGNSAAHYGGGIANNGEFYGSATLTVVDSTVSNNSAGDSGGGIDNYRATLTVANSTVSGNSAVRYGGGIDNEYATLATVTNSTLSGNWAGISGGGINNYRTTLTTLTLANCTLSGNSAAPGNGGGIDNYYAALEIGNTILQVGASGGTLLNTGVPITSRGYNLSSDGGGGFLTGPYDQVISDFLLGPLADNGGPTWTHALLPGSPAINAGNPGFTPPPNFDQRGPGYPRVVNGRIDIGAFESHPPMLDVSSAPSTGVAGSLVTFTATATDIDVGDTLVFSLANAPAGASLDPSTGGFTWTPTAAGSFTFDVIVTDRGGLSDTKTVTVDVSSLAISGVAVTARNSKTLTITLQITNPNTATAYNVTLTASSMNGYNTTSALPLVFGAIKSGVSKKCTLQFKNVLSGSYPLTVNGTSSLGDFFTTQTLTVP